MTFEVSSLLVQLSPANQAIWYEWNLAFQSWKIPIQIVELPCKLVNQRIVDYNFNGIADMLLSKFFYLLLEFLS